MAITKNTNQKSNDPLVPANAVWAPKNGLNTIDDESFSKAQQFYQRDYVHSITFKMKDNEPVVVASFNVVICEPPAQGGVCRDDGSYHTLTRGLTTPLSMCSMCTCGENRCVPLVAAYMKYLGDRWELNRALGERQAFRERAGFVDQVYEFDWKPKGKALEIIPQSYIDVALELLEKNLITIRPTLTDSGCVSIDFDNRICKKPQTEDPQFTLADLRLNLDKLGNAPSNMEDGVGVSTQFNPAVSICKDACPNCHCDFCPMVTAGYIKFLRGNRREAVIENADRERSKHPENVKYGPELPFPENPELAKKLAEQITCISQPVLDGVARILDSGQAAVFPHVKDNENDEEEDNVICRVALRYLKQGEKDITSAKTIEDIYCDSPEAGIFVYRIKSLDVTGKDIPFWDRVLRVIVILDYLRKSSSYDTTKLSSRRRKVVENLKRKAEVMPGLERIMRLADSDKANSLFCIIEGNKNTGKRKIVQNIAEVLAQKGKIKTKEYQKCTFEELSKTLVREYEPAYRDQGDPYSYPAGPYYEGKKFNTFERNVLYVITGLKAFLRETIDNDSRHRPAIEHVMKILGRAEKDTYIIIIGLSEEDVDQFLALDSRYKFLYAQNRLHLDNMTTEQLCDAYLAELSKDVRAQILDEDEFRQKFAEFMAFNEKFLPIGNTELVNYLANYSNVEGKPELPPNAYNTKKAAMALEEMIGMNAIKQQIRDFEAFIAFQKKAKASGINIEHGNLHMQFTGNPGTGKTTVARIIATMLFDIGVLPQNKLVEVERKDLVAAYVGQTALKTGDVIKEALGGVLFIDEAYSLALSDGDSFGKEAIATLVKAMEDHKDNLIVILAGYEKEMSEFLKANSGIESRIGYTFKFDNYSLSELSEMYEKTLTKQHFTLAPGVRKAMENVTEFFVSRRYFGNGRFVKKMAQETIIKHAKNEGTEGWQIDLITEQDVPTVESMSVKTSTDENRASGLDDLVGLDDIKEQIRKFQKTVAFRRKASNIGISIPRGNNHMLFCGNPGTGKTTIARIMAKELFDAGIVPENKLIEVGRQDLVGMYLGQTAPKTQDVVTRALGGVLFIDEAYSLTSSQRGGGDSYGEEAVTTLVKAMEDYKDNLVIIFSGYSDKMDEFVASNPGIASRIGFTFRFKDYDAAELTEIFRRKLKKTGLIAEDADMLAKAKSIMQYFISVPNFGNGRFAERVVQMTYEIHAERCLDETDPDVLSRITVDDIPSVKYLIEHMANGDEMMNPDEIEESQHTRTAVHELGHAIVCKILFPKTPIERITISAEGNGALGYVQHKGYGIGNKTASDLRKQICVNMAGIASEELLLGEYGNGGTSDLSNATEIAWAMISRYGMSKSGFTVIKERDEKSKAEIDGILRECFDEAKKIISANAKALEKAMEVLLKDKAISDEDLTKIMEANE